MARRRRRKQGNWRPARDGQRMIQYDDRGEYMRHVSMDQYEAIRAHAPELREMLRRGLSIAKALGMIGCDPTGGALAAAEFFVDWD